MCNRFLGSLTHGGGRCDSVSLGRCFLKPQWQTQEPACGCTQHLDQLSVTALLTHVQVFDSRFSAPCGDARAMVGSAHLRSALLGVASGRDAQSCPRECVCELFHLLQCDAVAKNKGERYIAVS